MTAKTQVEHVVDARYLAAPPTVGIYFASPNGAVTVLLVTRIARVATGGRTDAYRLYCLRLRRSTLPPDVTVLPWPREHRGRGRPSRAAEPPDPSDRPIVTRQQKAAAERKRIVQIRHSHRDPANQLAEPVRVANKTLVAAEFRDPDDNNPNHRVPRTVKSFRNVAVIDHLLQTGTINKTQCYAARRFRDQYEKSCGLGLGQRDLAAPMVASGTAPVGISEMTLFALDAVRQVQRLLNGLYPLVLAVVVDDTTLRVCAARMGLHPAATAGRLVGALEVLAGHYTPPEAPTAERHTIGAQLGVT